MSEVESWLPVPGHSGYEVSDWGRVRSVDRTITIKAGKRAGHEQRLQGVMLRQNWSGNYLKVNLGRRVDGRPHVLVLEAFVGPRPDGLQACHQDDDRTNNRLENLRWDTPRENMLDVTRNGKNHNALKTKCPKGHPYDEKNTGVEGRGKRYCRTCNNADCAARYQLRKKRTNGPDQSPSVGDPTVAPGARG